MSRMKRSPRALFCGLSMTAVAVLFGTFGACGTGDDCAQSAFTIAFSPMYSAYESSHTYRVPAVVPGLAAQAITWSASDSSVVSLANDPVTGGVMITVKKTGTVKIIAHAGNLCGASLLTVTPATAEEWSAGNSTYAAACESCHGENSTSVFKDVAHTPEQTGGYSDSDLDLVIRQGLVPDGGYYVGSIVPQAAFPTFHKFSMTDPELKGVIVYLRSLAPAPQTGRIDFGGRTNRDGGHGPPRNDGGGFRPPDGGQPNGGQSDGGQSDGGQPNGNQSDGGQSDGG